MAPADLHAWLVDRIRGRLALAQAATPGPWEDNTYSTIIGPGGQRHHDWSEPLFAADHTLERYGGCEPCGDWKPGWLRGSSPGLGHGCRHFDEDYELDPLVAGVPSHHGDTATGRHAADMRHIAANHPAQVIADCEAALRMVERHAPDPLNPDICGYCCEPIPDEHGVDEACNVDWPCDDLLDLAAPYTTDPDAPQELRRG